MKKLFQSLILFLITGCSNNDGFYVYPSSNIILETPEYIVEQIFDGPNIYATTAVIVSTPKKYSEKKLIEIKSKIIQEKLTTSILARAPFIIKHSNKAYGVLFRFSTPKEKKEEFIEIDSIKYYVNKQIETMDNEKMEILGKFAFLDHYETGGYKNTIGILTRDKKSGGLSFNGRKVDLVKNKLRINTSSYYEAPNYEYELQLQRSGDLGFYSHENKGLHSYYLKIE